MTKDLQIMMNYRRLKNIKRCSTFPVVNPEDVAQHSFFVTMLVMALGDEYNTFATEHNLGFHPLDDENQYPELNMELLMRKALLHDTEEAITSDIPRSVKHMSPEFHKMLSDALDIKINEFYQDSSTTEIYHNIGHQCKNGFEGQFVDIADMLELGIYCYEEYSMSNHAIKPLLDKCICLIKTYTGESILEQASPLFNSIMELLQSPVVSMETMLDIN